jgi:hypothetical protein
MDEQSQPTALRTPLGGCCRWRRWRARAHLALLRLSTLALQRVCRPIPRTHRKLGYAAVASFNPYWDRLGLTFEDPDGYRVVLQHESWDP